MTSPLRISRENYIDSALLSASSSVGSLPSTNLKDQDIQRIWRSTGSPAWVLADLGQSRTIGATGLINTNAGLTDTVRVRVSTTDATGVAGNAYDSGSDPAAVDPVYGMFIHFIEPAVTGRYVRIDLTQSEIPEAGRWFAGPAWIPSRDFSFGWEQARQDHSRRAYSLGQNIFIDRLQRQRFWRFTLNGLTVTEVDDELEPLNRDNGSSIDILVCRDNDSTNLGKVSIWGLLDEAVAYRQPHPNFFEAEMIIRERL